MFWQTLPPAMSAASSPTMAKSPQRASSNQTFLLHPKFFFNFSIISERHGPTSAVTTFLLTDFIQAQPSELSKVRCHLTGTVMNNRKDVPAVMKKPKLKKGENVAYRNNENNLLLAWRDKCLVTIHLEYIQIRVCQEESKRQKRRRNGGETKCYCKLHEEHGWSRYC
jgi:hypothetical protein